MAEITRFVGGQIENSITTDSTNVSAVDIQSPLTFAQWVQYSNQLFTNAEDFLQRYQSYLNNWYQIHGSTQVSAVSYTQSLYTQLINEIVLDYTTTDEQRFLQNIDVNNPRDLAIAIPFFAQKIKEICIYYSTLRDEVKTSNLRYNLKGSNVGIEMLIYNEISKSLETQDLVPLIRTLNLSLSGIRNNIIVEIEDLYDTYSNYYDLNPQLSAITYNTISGDRLTYFNANEYTIDPYLYTDFNRSIIQAITSYPFYAIELGTNNFTITPEVSSTQLDLLKDSDFINLINTQDINNLKISLEQSLNQKYIGTDFYYLSTDTNNNTVSGLLFSAQASYANYLNKRYPSIAAIPSTDFLQTAKEIGLFFKPDKIGISIFNSFNFTSILNLSSLTPNTIYIFPDPGNYGNISSTTNTEYSTPFTVIEDNSFNKIDVANQYRFGDVEDDSKFQTFRAYQSRDQSLGYQNTGLSRYIDPQDFFDTIFKNKWGNSDVFPLIPANTFPIDSREQTLLPINETLVQFKTDIYGNEYGLYKNVNPQKLLTNNNLTQAGNGSGEGSGDATVTTLSSQNTLQLCQVLDGYVFLDPISGYNFDYTVENDNLGYSGIVTQTTNNIPPGSGYWTHGPTLTSVSLSALSAYNLGAPTFALSTSPILVASYRLQPELFCSNYITDVYICNIIDGVTFVSPSSGKLPDVSSDIPTYDPLTSSIYYTELIDAGVSPVSPTYVPNFQYAADFTFTAPNSTYNIIDGYKFVVNGVAPCGGTALIDNKPLYVEPSNFVNIRIPNKTSTVITNVTGLSARLSIYDTRNVVQGDLYYRNSNSTIIQPISSALSSIYINYPQNITNEINNNIINFDIYYDIIQIETENYLVFDEISFDYSTNTVQNTINVGNYLYKGNHSNLEKVSNTWFNETDNNLIVCKTTLFWENSASNYKIVYPKIYVLNLDTFNFTQLYPNITDNALTFNLLADFSLSGTGIDVNIVEIEKPILNYSNETGRYSLVYLGKDSSGMFYIFNTSFQYFNGILTNVNTVMQKTASDVYSQNFGNLTIGNYLITNTIYGTNNSTISGNEYIFG